MKLSLFPSHEQFSSRLALVAPDSNITWQDFGQRISEVAANYSDVAGQRIGLQLTPTSQSLIQFFSLLQSEAHLFLMNPAASSQDVTEWSADLGLANVIRTDGSRLSASYPLKPGSPTAVTILTSGTTGKPKAVEHSWASLTRPVRDVDPTQGASWLLTYRPHLYAGLQVMLQCLLNYGTLALPAADGDAESVAKLAANVGVEYASATPSYWRWLLTLARDHLPHIPLRQITLGGEAVDQNTLDALKSTFPQARLVHIYATTELGRCFSVTDGRAGFPAMFLDAVSTDGVHLNVAEGGELVVRSGNAMLGYDGSDVSPQTEWFHTGDLVQRDGDRFHFIGRMTDMINVGGNKVYPVEIEKFLREIPGVADTRVYGESSSIVGELVKCDIVAAAGQDPQELEKEIRRRVLEGLTNYQRPRFISMVQEIPRTAAGKVKR